MEAAGVLFALALVFAPVHLEDESPSEEHCAVCHLRHVSVLAPQATLTEIAALVAASASFAPETIGRPAGIFIPPAVPRLALASSPR